MDPDSRWLVLLGALVGLALGLGLAAVTRNGDVRILPLGDSITEGKWQRPSYRPALWQRLHERGCQVDFVGSQGGPAGELHYDDDHEGHWGWRTDEIAAGLPDWLPRRGPNIALVHLGTNDVLQDVPTPVALAHLRTILEQLRASNPHITILLAQVIPAHPSRDAGIAALNAGIAALAAAEDTQASRIRVVDLHTGYDRALNYDGLHPDARGAALIAQRWHDALAPLLASRCRDADGDSR